MTARRLLIAVALLAAAVGVAVYLLSRKHVHSVASDLVAASAANARGVGLMEQFDYAKATAEFEQAAELAPAWTPARVNLGIALYNSTKDPDDLVLARSIQVLKDVLAAEPDNLHAHYNLGIIQKYRGEYEEAKPHFRRVTELDPTDAHAWLFLGASDPESATSAESAKHYETALKLNPYLNQARYRLATHASLLNDPARKDELLKLFTRLQEANWEDESREKYTELGRYASVIATGPAPPPAVGPVPAFNPTPAITKLPAADSSGSLLRLDFDGDGRPDVLLLSCGAGDVLLRNTGSGFEDVTAAAGLTGPGTTSGAVGDFDNDGRPDLALSGAGGLKLLRNVDGKRFEDVTKTAGLAAVGPVQLVSGWLDIDQDGDLDLLVSGPGGLRLFLNVGVAPPSRADQPVPPLTAAFKPFDWPADLQLPAALAGVVAADLDGDGDVDLVVLSDSRPAMTILNDRLLRFRRGPDLPGSARFGLALDANGDDQSDFLLLGDKPTLLVSTTDAPGGDLAARFAAGATDSPPLAHAHRTDLDRDGRADVIGLSRDRKPVFLHGDGKGKLTNRSDALPPAADVWAAAVFDADGDGVPDLVCWATGELRVYRGIDNGNHAVRLALTGKRDSSNAGLGQKNLRTNTDAVGAKVAALAGSLTARAELTTLSAGQGQSLLPIDLGLGRATVADAVRIRWPDLVVQSELAVAAGNVVRVGEINRKPTSCPVLMTWDGAKWVYVTDCLGGGALGEMGPDGSVRPSRPSESVAVRADQMGLKDGRYLLRVTEPMDEVLYLDHVRLDVVDAPAGVTVLPDERFAVATPLPTEELLVFKDKLFPVKATDHRGRDVRELLKENDGRTVSDFARRSWLGYAEDHWVEFDFGDTLPSGAWLVLAGWTDYPYPESIFAATQAGVPTVWPVLETKTAAGWKEVAVIGLPAGLPKTMTVPLPAAAGGRFRVRTNLQIHWDQAYLAAAGPSDTRVSPLSPASAVLSHPGFVKEIGDAPVGYDPHRFEAVAVSKWAGTLTRLGDVTELAAAVDDRFVLAGPGDEVTLNFDASKLPPLPTGWTRSFVLRTHGYCKDTAPTTLTGGKVGPLPHRDMAAYPCPETPQAAADRAAWHTRPAGR